MFCECGCGREVTKVGNRFILGHQGRGKHRSAETRKKISEAHKGLISPFYGKRHSVETRKKMREAKKRKYMGENNPFYGKHHSAETRKKMSESHTGKPLSIEHRKKISETMREKHHSDHKHGKEGINKQN